MKRILLGISLLSMLLVWSPLEAQTYNDGCGDITFTVQRTWNQEYEDPFFNDETNWRFGFLANADVDGDGLRSTGCIVQGGSWQIGWYNNPDITIPTFSYAGNSLPEFFTIRGEFQGDDWGGPCDYQTGFFIDDDDYRYNEVVLSAFDYRAAGPPNTNNVVQLFTTNHGSSDYGMEFRVRYTSPRPDASANVSFVCQGSSTNVVLTMTGAIYSGQYRIYRDGILIGTTTSSTYTDVGVSGSHVYTVKTRNNSVESLCSSAAINLVETNCSFNCVRREATMNTYSFDWSQGNVETTDVSFDAAGIPAGSYIADVDVDISFNKTDGSCASPSTANLSYHGETHFWLYSENAGLQSTSLVDGGVTNQGFTGSANINPGVTVNFDQDNATNISGTPINGATYNPAGNLDLWKWQAWSTSSAVDWYIRAGDSGNTDPLCVQDYGVTVCGCKPPVANSVRASDGTTTTSGTLTVCATQPSITLSATGSISAFNNNGYGDDIRWFRSTSSSCTTTGTQVGTGISIVENTPSAGTYYYKAYYYVDGERCRNSTAYCDAVQVIVNPDTDGGDVYETATTNNSKIICFGNPVNLTLQNHVGSVLNWEYSTDAVSWTNVSNTTTTYTAFPLSPGQFFVRAQVRSGLVCDPEYSEVFTITVKPDPVAGNIFLSEDTLCVGGAVAASLNGHTGDDLQWQISSAGAGGPFNDIAGENSVNLATAETNATTSPITFWYRVRIRNAPCLGTVYTPAKSVTYDPAILPGTVDADQTICLDENAADVILSGNNASVIRWEIDNNPLFTTPAVITSTSTTLDGADIDGEIGTSTNVQLYVRAVTQNACPEDISDSVIVRYNEPDPIVMADATGTCNVDNAGTWVHIYDPTTDRLICSVNDIAQDLGDVTASVYYHGGSAFTVPTTSPCAIVPQGVLNRSFVINSSKPVSAGIPVVVRLYFTDAELADLISLAGCGDPEGCADNDDVCGINDLVVTQIHDIPSPGVEDGVFDPGLGTTRLIYPTNSGTGDANFGGNYVQFTVTQFSEFWIHGTERGYPLPVELTSFEAKPVNNQFVVLNWLTATEINNDGFEIQRSTDGFNFETIGWAEGNGTTTEINHYSYQDNDVEKGIYYYRLMQVDFDGAFEYSEIKTASIYGSDNNGVSFFIPNPADHSTKLNLTLVKASEISLVVYDEVGRVVENRREFLEEGVHDVELNTSSYAAGAYSAILMIDGSMYTRKLIIKN